MKTLLFKPSFYYFFLLLRSKFFPFIDKYIRIGKYKLKIPGYHLLDLYKYCFSEYDESFARICKILSVGKKKTYAIDIGANIGDSAIQMNKFNDVSVLCVEGDSKYFNYLSSNCSQLKFHSIEKCFVGDSEIKKGKKHLKRSNGTTKITDSSHGGSEIIFKTLQEIVNSNPVYMESSFIKIDTDGYDFQIINANIKILKKINPVLYYENSINNLQELEASNNVIRLLHKSDYDKFVILDNFGRKLAIITKSIDLLFELNNFLLENSRTFSSINYFDIIAFPKKHTKVFNKFISLDKLS